MKSKKEKVATLGASTAVPSDETAKSLELTNKVRVLGRVVTKVVPESPADQAGLKVDDVLLRLGSNDLYSADDIADFLSVSKPGDKVALVFKRPGSTEERETTVTFGEVEQAAATGPRLVCHPSRTTPRLPGQRPAVRWVQRRFLVKGEIRFRLTDADGRTSIRLVMARLLTSLFVAFMLLVAPALCVSGLVTHECDCGQGGAEMQCEHEDSCSDDPCESLATVTQDRGARSLLDIEVPWVPVAVVARDVELASIRWSRSARPPLPPDRWNLPYAQSDRPLLI